MTWPPPPRPMDGFTRTVLLMAATMLLCWAVGAVLR